MEAADRHSAGQVASSSEGGQAGQFDEGADPGRGEGVAQMGAHGVRGQEQLCRDVAGGGSACDELNHCELGRGDCRERACRRGVALAGLAAALPQASKALPDPCGVSPCASAFFVRSPRLAQTPLF